MASKLDAVLFREDWSGFPIGHIHRDSTARGEYMSMVVPPNPNGWYHNGNMGLKGTPDRNHSAFHIRKTKSGRVISLDKRGFAPMVVLTTGPKRWHDITVSALTTVRDILPVGIIARYQTNRDGYAAYFESGVFKLARVFQGEIHILDSVVCSPGKKPVCMTLSVDGTALKATAGKATLTATDGCIESGGIGLWANGPADFGAIDVLATEKEVKRIAREESVIAARVSAKRKSYPAMELVASISVKGHAVGRQLRFADLNGDGREELLFAVPTVHPGSKWKYNKICRMSALTLDGDVLWERGAIQPDSMDITADLPFQVGDRGAGMEIVSAWGDTIEVLDALTGKTKRKTRTPKAPKMPAFWDEINMYWGDGHGDDVPFLIPDAIRLCNLTGQHPHGDFYIKDRYHNVWGIDGRTLKVLWHHQANCGHHPFTCDLKGKGVDEVIMGYSRLDNNGNLTGRLYLGDHPDGCFSYIDSNGLRHNMHPCGEAGFIDEYDDWRISEVHLGHVQHLSIGNFIPDRPDLERIIVTYHGNEGIIVLMDMDNRVIRKAERYGAGAVCQPTNWTGDGRELIGYSPRHRDGGLMDEHFDLVVPFPSDDRPGKYMEVHDMLGLGVDQVIVWDEDRLQVYASSVLPSRKGKRYSPIKPGPNFSNYQVNYSIPRWV